MQVALLIRVAVGHVLPGPWVEENLVKHTGYIELGHVVVLWKDGEGILDCGGTVVPRGQQGVYLTAEIYTCPPLDGFQVGVSRGVVVHKGIDTIDDVSSRGVLVPLL